MSPEVKLARAAYSRRELITMHNRLAYASCMATQTIVEACSLNEVRTQAILDAAPAPMDDTWYMRLIARQAIATTAKAWGIHAAYNHELSKEYTDAQCFADGSALDGDPAICLVFENIYPDHSAGNPMLLPDAPGKVIPLFKQA